MITQTPSRCASSADVAEPSCKDHSFDSIPYDVELVAAIEEARASMRRGDFITFEEFEKEIDSWFSE
jgi:predicted transcriptional regulator